MNGIAKMNKSMRPGGLVIIAALCLLGVVSCKTTPERGAMDLPQTFSTAGEVKAPDRWWESFDDERLNALVDEAMSENLDILTAWDRLDQAIAIAKIANAPLWPNANAGFSVTDVEVVGGDDPLTVEDTFYGLSLTASYEIDLWGRIRSGRNAARADMLATRENLDTVAITISGEIARTWYELIEARRQLDILAEQKRVNETSLGLLELRFNQGLARAVDVLQQRQVLSGTLSEIPLAESRFALLNHQLSVLLGKPPATEIELDGGVLPHLPPLPSTGVPSDLLLRRPDVRAAQLQLEAADYRVREAIADRFPRLSISISAQDTETEFSSLFDNWIRNLAANITAPIIDGGRRRSEVERTRAVASESLHTFENAVLGALKEVEDALVREHRQAEFVASLAQQVDIARQTVEFTRERYMNGDTDYLPVLTALQTLQSLERSEIEAQRQLVTNRINLYRALSGGWNLGRAASDRADVIIPDEGDAS